MANIKKGWIFAAITALIWSMNAVYYQSISAYVDNLNGPVSILLSMISGAFLLLILAGPGRLSVETLKSKNTWIFGSLLILGYMMAFAKYFVGLNVLEGTALARYGVIISMIYMYLSTGRVVISSKLGLLLIFTGLLVITMTLPAEIRYIALFWLILGETTVVLRARVAETHTQNTDATGDVKSELRVTGYILSVTSLMFIIILFIAMKLGFNESIPNIVPSFEEFFALTPFLLAVFVGAIIMASMKYSEMIATKHVGTVNFFVVTAFVPILTVPTKYIVSIFTIVPAPVLDMPDVIGTALITVGAIITVKNSQKKKTKKLAPKARRELQVLRDTIQTAMVCFNDNEELVAEKLGVGKRTIKGIMTTEKEVSKNIKNKIIFNHAQNVAGLDHLTGALNKSSFEAKLKDLENTEKALVLFIDLDKFKPVNDTYGHKAGDSILEGVAERLMDEFNHPHVVARLGGDEFCLIVYGKDKKDEEKLVKKVEKLVTEPFIVEGVDDEISVGCSIGSVHYPTEGNCGLELNKVADERMYEAKLANGVER